jgi:hypothetical protein
MEQGRFNRVSFGKPLVVFQSFFGKSKDVFTYYRWNGDLNPFVPWSFPIGAATRREASTLT